jgi:ubiquinol-cytochrome c reductase cytochrome b subunit
MFLGHIVRGIHHYSAQAMILLLGVHMLQVIVDGAYRAPREVNFWLGLILAQIILAMSLTGYLLPWDQKGYYATQVSTKIVGATPGIGVPLQELVQGGPQYGHHTLTRFFAMHAGLLPALLGAVLFMHIYVFRRHGLTAFKPDQRPTTAFWPDQVLRDAVACLGVLAVVMLLAVYRGAELSAPANPSEAYSAARPEWYFLSLFRLLRFEVVERYGLAFGAIYVPGAVLSVIVLMPLIALVKGGHYFNVAFMSLVACALVSLTVLAVVEDRGDADHQAALAEAHRDAHRAVELAQLPAKIPVEGAGTLLRDDPFAQGPRLFAKYCASCHHFDGHNGRGRVVAQVDPHTEEVVRIPASAPDLGHFATRDWWREVLTNFEQLFSPAAGSGYDLAQSAEDGMISWFRENQEVLRDKANEQDIAAMVEYLTAQSGRADLEVDADLAARGEELLRGGELTSGSITTCDNCHAEVGGTFTLAAENGGIPELNGYGSAPWLTAIIKDAGHEQFFGDKNKMPPLADKIPQRELDLLVRYLTGDFPATHIPRYAPPEPASGGATAADE